jgi:hypothetical protein
MYNYYITTAQHVPMFCILSLYETNIFSGKGLQQINCGTNHSACIDKDGSLYIWGDNQHGQCAKDPSKQGEVLSPSCVELSSSSTCEHRVSSPDMKEAAYKVGCGASHGLALGVDGNVWVWGHGPQLGLGDIQHSWKPTILKTFKGKKVIDICSGEFHNSVLVADGKHSESKSKEVQDGLEAKAKDSISNSITSTSCVQCMSPLRLDGLEKHSKKLDIVSENGTVKHNKEYHAGVTADKSETVIQSMGQSSEGKPVAGINVDDVFVKLEDDKVQTDKESNVLTDKLKSEHKDSEQTVIEGKKVVSGEKSLVDAEQSIYDVYGSNSKTDTNESKSSSDTGSVDIEGVELRKKSSIEEPKSLEDILTSSIKSDSSHISSLSSKSTRSRSFLDDTGAREYLARQFQDEDVIENSSMKLDKKKSDDVVHLTAMSSAVPSSPSSPGGYMMQTVSTLTSHVSSMTTKAISNIASVPGKFRFSGASAGAEDETKSSTETLEVSEISDLETGSTENISSNLDKSILDFSNLTVSDTSLNASQLSLPESEKSNDSAGSQESSPVKKKRNQSNRLSVSKESQSIRTIEAKQENLRKRSLSLLTQEGMYCN